MQKKTVITPSQIRDFIEEDILNSTFEPGAKLDEASLCERFSVSRTPIREALRQLSARGLVELVPNRGAFLVELSTTSLVEMFEVLGELEGMCGRLAARRIPTDLREELVNAQHQCEVGDGERDTYYEKNAAFHEVIYKGCQNAFLAQQVKQLHHRLRPYHRLQFSVANRLAESHEEHQAIVDAILRGDEEQAELLQRDHVLIQGKRFSDFIALLNAQ